MTRYPRVKKTSQIVSLFQKVATTNHYEVFFSGFGAMTKLRGHISSRAPLVNNWFITRDLGLLCSAAELPATSFGTAQIEGNRMGVVEKMAHTRIFTDTSMTFYCDMDYRVVQFFELWQDLIVGPHRERGDLATQFGTKDLNYLDNFTCQITIHCFSEVGGRQGLKEVYNCTLQEAYPRTIQDLQLDWSANDVARLNVVFDYKYFRDESFNEIRIIQPNIAQKDKWKKDLGETHFNKLVRLSNKNASNVDLLIWPETSVPSFLEYKRSFPKDISSKIDNPIILIKGLPGNL